VDVEQQELRIYIRSDGRRPFDEWHASLDDCRIQAVVDVRLARLRAGLFGDCRAVGQGVVELRIHVGPGFRIYLGRDGRTMMILLCGGDKSSQSKDIRLAAEYWKDYLRRKADESK
jgi:putative addiction module killer protein